MSIEGKAVSGLRWIGATRFAGQLISWSITLVVMRLLSPSDYGLMASISVLLALLDTVSELGMAASIVQAPTISTATIRSISGLSVLAGALAMVLVCCLAPLIGWLFRDQRLVPLTFVASTQFLIASLSVVQGALLTRELQFRRVAAIELLAAVGASLVTLTLALQGCGAWSLLGGNLALVGIRTSALLVFGARISPSFNFSGLRRHFLFGGTLVANRAAYTVILQSDLAVASRFLPKDAVGVYAVAVQLATLPMQKLMGLVNQITLPAVARIQDEPQRVRDAMVKVLSVMSLFSIPLLWGISAVAPELVHVLIGAKWESAVLPISIICLVVPFRMISAVTNTAVLGLGIKRLDLINTVSGLLIIPSCYVVGVHWGVVGLATAWLVGFPVTLAITLRRSASAVGLSLSEVARCIGPAAICGLMMYLAILVVRRGTLDLDGLWRLLVLVCVGAVTYILAALLLARKQLPYMRSFLLKRPAGNA